MFRRLSTFDEAQRVIRDLFPSTPLGSERLPLYEAYGKVLAADIESPIDIPPFDKSTVDGYAVRSVDTFGAEEDSPVTLRLKGTVNIGERPEVTIDRWEAVEIPTGAPLPEGGDSVVMLEDTDRRDGKVFIYRPVALGENVMRRGTDIKVGEVILKEGTILSPFEIGVLAAVGRKEIDIYRRPKVAVLSTGPELIAPGNGLTEGKIYDINSYTLGAAVRRFGGEPIILDVVKDDEELIKRALKRALAEADIVITSGGVSVGKRDVIPKVLGGLGKPGVLISGVAMKPGKPNTLAMIGDKPIFSLPGHPTSALLGFYLFVKPVLLKMAGRRVEPFEKVKAVNGVRLFSAKGRRTFTTVTLRRESPERVSVWPVPTGLSGAITTIARADGFVEIPEKQQFIDEGEEVTVHLFRPAGKLWRERDLDSK